MALWLAFSARQPETQTIRPDPPPLPTKPLHSGIRPRLQDVQHCKILPFGNAFNPDRGERAARPLDRLVNAGEERGLKCDGNRQR
jgi:hypothetical protein